MHGRHHLPWQANPTAYRVWVSEVMLQQTQVITVIPYYERFMARFPDRRVARRSRRSMKYCIFGPDLGYYARARNLHACARAVVAEHGGEFPSQLEAMMALPGIGRSTAGAILALSGGQRHPILDGNVKRVLARAFGIAGDPNSSAVSAALWAQSDACTPTSQLRQYTQAIMDLGATVCTRAQPACTVCPLNAGCVAALEGRQAELPGRKQRRVRPSRETTLLIAHTGRRWIDRGARGTAARLGPLGRAMVAAAICQRAAKRSSGAGRKSACHARNRAHCRRSITPSRTSICGSSP